MMRWILVVCFACSLVVQPHAQADDTSGVALTVVGQREGDDKLAQAVAALLQTNGFTSTVLRRSHFELTEVVEAQQAGTANRRARAWIDLGRSDVVTLVSSNAASNRFARRVLFIETLDESARETIAQVVSTTLAALGDPDAPALTRPQLISMHVEQKAATQVVPPTAKNWQLGVGYEARALSTSLLLQGLRLQGARMGENLGAHVRPLAWAAISASLAQPYDLESNLNVGLRMVAASAGGGLEFRLMSGLRIAALAGGAMHVIEVDAGRGTTGALTLSGRQRATRWSAHLALRFAYPVSPRWDVYVQAGCEAGSRLRLDITNAEGAPARTVLRGPAIEPLASVGFAVAF